MSTIGQLLAMAADPGIRPWDEAQRSVNEVQTGLLQLQEMKREQETAARTRQFLQEHPEMLMGQGGGSTIGSLMQPSPQGAGPRPDPMALQAVPGRNAGVSPQGGGPIPPDVMAQTMPHVTPPQSTIASLGQPQGDRQALQNRYLLDLARTSPEAALKVQQLQQGQQDRQFKLEEQRLDWTGKKMGYFGQLLQGVNSPESYADAVQEIGRVDPQAAARLPRTYNKEALQPFIKQALSVKESADLQLRTLHEQTEQGKLQVQLAQAGYQGLGDDVTGIIRGLSEEQVKQFGGRTTPAAIAYATEEARKLKPVPGQTADVTTELRAMKKDPWKADDADIRQAIKNIDDRALGRAQAAEIQRGQTERELRGDKTVSEVMGTKATNIFDTQTGETGNIAKMKIKDYEALPEGRAKELSPRLTEQMENINNAVPIVAQLQEHIDKIYGPGGVLARMSPDERVMLTNAPGQWAKQYAQKYPELIQAQRFIDANKGGLSRALAGEKGAMSEGDVDRAGAMLPNLETALKVWPPTEIGWRQPDTKDVALRSMNSIVDMINARGRTLLGNEKYAHPKLHRYETAQEVEKTGGDPQAQPTLNAPAPPIPPLVGPNPNLPKVRQPGEIPVLGGPGMPEQYLPPPGTQSQAAPAPAPAPSAPAAKPTPGRQPQATTGRRGVELARASGMKVMDMADVEQAMADTGKSRAEVLAAAKQRGYTVYGSSMPMPSAFA